MPWSVSSTGDPLCPHHDPAGACAAVTELMGELMAAFDELPRVRRGPLHSLYAALRRRAPQMSAARPAGDEGALRVAYRGRTGHVVWDDDLGLYAWDTGEGGDLGPDAEKAAELIAAALGAVPGPDPLSH